MLAHNTKLKELWDKTPKKELYESVLAFEKSPETDSFTEELLKQVQREIKRRKRKHGNR